MTSFEKYNFGKRLLESQGWTSGKGLGRNESGIAEAIKPSLKFDKTGVGHNAADDLTFNWWDHLYKNAASNIIVEQSEDGVEMKQIEDHPDLISNKKWKIQKRKKKKSPSDSSKPLTYGVFVKSSVLTKDGEVKEEVTEKALEKDDGDEEDDGNVPHQTDEILLEACEGRTAHKGARHGLTASGKLKRLEAQESGKVNSELFTGPKTKRQRTGTVTADRTPAYHDILALEPISTGSTDRERGKELSKKVLKLEHSGDRKDKNKQAKRLENDSIIESVNGNDNFDVTSDESCHKRKKKQKKGKRKKKTKVTV